ncbi:hypothetical protein KFE25_007009 [Diacronema lutheri]|uniref:Uncharacterized protein n=2 Tax=Diacronema lutheri TaxID=2081491 RepID=A0A8J5XT78_DIALT|nr:hypothetical protein KFE25_007009 [Diacronema lutheri]
MVAARQGRAIVLLSLVDQVVVLFSPAGGRHQLPSHGVYVSRTALSGVECLRNCRKNSADPRPAGQQTTFMTRRRRHDPDDGDEDDAEEDEGYDGPKPQRRSLATRARAPNPSGVWSNRSLAARRRWADPEYRDKVVRKRMENAAPKSPKSALAIGPLDSVVFSPSQAQTEIWRSKADEINRWARANQLRREGALRWKRDPMGWTLANLEAGKPARSRLDNDTYKIVRQEQRRLLSVARWETRRRNEALAPPASAEAAVNATALASASTAPAVNATAPASASTARRVARGQSAAKLGAEAAPRAPPQRTRANEI